MRIAVIGTGYVGLVAGICFAEMGNKVFCIDVDENKVQKLTSGELTIYEPGLEKYFLRNLSEGRLDFRTSLNSVINEVEIVFLALPTPTHINGDSDISIILKTAREIGKLLKSYKVIVNKSTVPVGTADLIKSEINKNYNGEFEVVSNPEFMREGMAVDDFMRPSRIILGTKSLRAQSLLQELYSPFIRQGNPIIFMDERSSELTKYAANCFLAMRVSFINEIANVCDKMGADVDMVRRGIGSDERIGKSFLFPGIGYGGSCFPKDIKAFIKSSDIHNYDFKILKAVEEVNALQKNYLVNLIKRYYQNDLRNKHFALWGLSFKPNTDDVREAPAISIVKLLLQEGARVTVFDPEAMENFKKYFTNSVKYAKNKYDALIDADALLIATEWSEFRTPDFDLIGNTLTSKVVFDGRNVFNVLKMQSLGYKYFSVGREKILIA